MTCTACIGVGRVEPQPPATGFGRGPVESWPSCVKCSGTGQISAGSPSIQSTSAEGSGKSGLRSPRYTEAQMREYQRCFGGHAREALENLVAEQPRVDPVVQKEEDR